MDDQVDWAERIEAAVDPAPDGFDPHAVLVLGHTRMRRRRRIITSAGAAAVIVGIAGTLWGFTPNAGRAPDDLADVATTTPTLLAPTPPAPEQALVRYRLNSGELVVRPGVVIARQVDDVVVAGLGTDSIAALVSFERQRWWTIASVTPGLSGWTDQHVAVDGRTFEQWVREKVVLNQAGRNAGSGWLRLDDSGEVTAGPGVTLIGQTSPARPDQAATGVLSAAGTIEVDGARLCFVVRKQGEVVDDFYVAESEYPGCGPAVPSISDALSAVTGGGQ